MVKVCNFGTDLKNEIFEMLIKMWVRIIKLPFFNCEDQFKKISCKFTKFAQTKVLHKVPITANNFIAFFAYALLILISSTKLFTFTFTTITCVWVTRISGLFELALGLDCKHENMSHTLIFMQSYTPFPTKCGYFFIIVLRILFIRAHLLFKKRTES